MNGQELTAPSYKDKRQFSRRSKTMRFRFDVDGQVYRAVCSNVSAGGAFLKASRVPQKGSQVLLSEVFRGNRDVGLRVEGEVVWTISKATLENPETGYAVQFSEAWTAGDTAPLKDFANVLNPGTEHVFESTDRDGQTVTLYRFPKLSAAPAPGQASTGPTTYDALPEVDLASELDRLDRQQRRRTQPPEEEDSKQESKALSYYTRARPKKPRPEGGPVTGPQQVPRASGARTAAAAADGRRSTQPPARADNILAGSSTGTPTGAIGTEADGHPGNDEHGDDSPHGSPRRRRFGGLLGLFGFGKEGEEGVGEDSGFDHSTDGLSPAFSYDGDESGEWYVSDEDPSLVLLSWKDHETEGLVEKLSATMMAVNTRGPAPLHYERVTVVPAFPSLSASRLTLHGTVTRIKDKQGDGSQTVLIRFSKVDERGKGGIFQDYLKLFQ